MAAGRAGPFYGRGTRVWLAAAAAVRPHSAMLQYLASEQSAARRQGEERLLGIARLQVRKGRTHGRGVAIRDERRAESGRTEIKEHATTNEGKPQRPLHSLPLHWEEPQERVRSRELLAAQQHAPLAQQQRLLLQ